MYVINGNMSKKNADYMWLANYTPLYKKNRKLEEFHRDDDQSPKDDKYENPSIKISFNKTVDLKTIRIYNYNIKRYTDCGVKRIMIKSDCGFITGKEGVIVRMASGDTLADENTNCNGFNIDLGKLKSEMDEYGYCLSQRRDLPINTINFNLKMNDTRSIRFNQIYKTQTHPSGMFLRIRLLDTWGDKHYIGLNEIEIYDENLDP